MRKILNRITITLAVTAILAGVAFMLLHDRTPTNQSIMLPDGTRLKYIGVSVGTNHFFELNSLHRFASHLPEWAQGPVYKVTGPPPLFATRLPALTPTTATNLTLWFDDPGMIRSDHLSNYPIGLNGQRMRGRQGGVHSLRDIFLGRSNRVFGVSFSYWPRRSKVIEFVVYPNNPDSNDDQIGSIRIHNPARVKSASWRPDAPGTTRTNGELKATLVSFTSGLGYWRSSNLNPQTWRNELTFDRRQHTDPPLAVFQIQIESPDSTTKDWRPYRVELIDETGNVVNTHDVGPFGGGFHYFTPVLWPYEPVWKLRFHLRRTRNVPAGERIRFMNIPLPLVNSTNHVQDTNELNGMKVVFKELIRRAPLPADQRVWEHSDLNVAVFEFEASTTGAESELAEIIAQPMGLQLTVDSRQRVGNGNSVQRGFYMKSIPTNATHLDFEFNAPKQHSFEFYVAPNWITNEYVVEVDIPRR